MPRKKGVPQRAGGLSREEARQQQAEEERSAQLARLDEHLEIRSRTKDDDRGGLDEGSPPISSSSAHRLPHAPSVSPVAVLPPTFTHPPPAALGSANGVTAPAAKHSPGDFTPPGLSRFAERYVPLWLRNVNASPPGHVVPRSPSESFMLDFRPLHDTLFSRQLLSMMGTVELKNQRRVELAYHQEQAKQQAALAAGSPAPSPVPPLTPTTYVLHYMPLLQAEYTARRLQLVQAALYAQPLALAERHPADPPGPPRYVLQAKSIREGFPPVDLGDVLTLRQLRPHYQTWQGLEFQGSVAGINRAAGEVILRCDGLMGYQETMIFNIQWRVQDRLFSDWRRAIEILELHLTSDKLLADPPSSSSSTAKVAAEATPSAKPVPRTAVESWLFPTAEDVAADAGPPNEDPAFQWVDESLNEEQRNAVRSIVWGQQRLPLLLHGPPGTGKTKTLVEAVLQLLKRNPDAHLLVCGASNPSTDTIASRLRSLAPKELFRLNSPSRPFAEVKAELLPFCHVEGDRFALPPLFTLLGKRVICCTVADASILIGARITNHDLSTAEVFCAGYIHPTRPPPLPLPHFSHLLVDEAGQATEPDTACALAVVATDDTRSRRAHVCLTGDYKQLGPQVVSEETRAKDLDISLLQRLIQRPVYAEHPYARKNRRRHPDAVWDIRTTPFVDLQRNYRSTPEILWLPSTEFYHDTLVPSASSAIQTSRLRDFHRLPNPGFPLMLQHVSGDDLEVDDGASFFNLAEVDVVKQLILDLVRPPAGDKAKTSHGIVAPREISVISPFREQVWRIRLALRAVGLGEVDVGITESLQGAENRVAIISTVRSKELRWLKDDRQKSRGLLFEPKRFNVAMTRAKELLMVVGNANTLTMDPWWTSFYRLCIRNDAYVGPPVSHAAANEPGHAVSRLEQDYHAKSATKGTTPGAAGESGRGEAEVEGKAEARDFDVLIGRMASQLVNQDDDDDFPPLLR
ncbi:hypothetical protein JCM10213v2_002751 [Rhodosporidiobolus nylandii]